LASVGDSCQLMSTVFDCWQLLKIAHNYYQELATIGASCHLLATVGHLPSAQTATFYYWPFFRFKMTEMADLDVLMFSWQSRFFFAQHL